MKGEAPGTVETPSFGVSGSVSDSPIRGYVHTKALRQQVGHASVSFTIETCVHSDLEADRE